MDIDAETEGVAAYFDVPDIEVHLKDLRRFERQRIARMIWGIIQLSVVIILMILISWGLYWVVFKDLLSP